MASTARRVAAAAASGVGGPARRTLRGAGSQFSTLTVAGLPKHVLDCEYAVRGAVLQKAEELQRRLESGAGSDLPFSRVVPCNIGNPQAVGQSPLRFHRQVLACLTDPSLVGAGVYAEDVCDRAVRYLQGIHDGRVGAYSGSKGHSVFRQDVCDWLERRDGFAADPEHVFLTDGASAAVKSVLQLAVRGPDDGVMIPIPQYPLYSASMTLLRGQTVGYYLDEEAGWGINAAELERSVTEFRNKGGNPRAICVINPGNPTGQVLSRDTMADVLRFAEREGLALLADEVYQDNIHADGKEFIPFRKLAKEIGCKAEVFSFHSVSKGVTGECGLRGGLVHCHNVDEGVLQQLYKLTSVSLCSNVLGQAMMASVVVPPPETGASFAGFNEEREALYSAMRRKAKRVYERLNTIEGISCQPIEGAMYAFPKVTIKGQVARKAASYAVPADNVYCLQMVERTGVVTVPGSGFGQRHGSYHFRMTILPDEETLEGVLDAVEKFHNEHAEGWGA